MLLAVKPSSPCTGYAVFEDAGSLVEFGRCTHKPGVTCNDRAAITALHLRHVCKERHISQAVIQTYSGRVRSRIKGAALPVRQADIFATGWLYGELRRCLGRAVDDVTEKVWTAKLTKRDWIRIAAQRFKLCRCDDEIASEAADAIGIGLWWFEQQKIENAVVVDSGG